MPREPITPRKSRPLRIDPYQYHSPSHDNPACLPPIFPCPSPDKKGAIAFPLSPVRTAPAPIFPYTPPCSSSPSTNPSCFHWHPTADHTPKSRIFSFCKNRRRDTLFGDMIEEYADIDHFRGWNPERERFEMPGENDTAREYIKSKSESGCIDLRIMWPGYPSAEHVYSFKIRDLTRRQVADVVAKRVYDFMKDIESRDKQTQRTSCTLRSPDGVGYSEYDIFHNKIEARNVILVALEHTHGNFWHPRLKLVGVGKS